MPRCPLYVLAKEYVTTALVICMRSAQHFQFLMPRFASVQSEGTNSFAVFLEDSLHLEGNLNPLIFPLFSFYNRFEDPNVKSEEGCILLGPAVCNVEKQTPAGRRPTAPGSHQPPIMHCTVISQFCPYRNKL